MGRFFRWLTNDITRTKSIIAMFLTAVIVWGPAIWYTSANYDERLALTDWQRWEIWAAIAGTLVAWLIWALVVIRDGKRKRKKEEQTRRSLTS